MTRCNQARKGQNRTFLNKKRISDNFVVFIDIMLTKLFIENAMTAIRFHLVFAEYHFLLNNFPQKYLNSKSFSEICIFFSKDKIFQVSSKNWWGCDHEIDMIMWQLSLPHIPIIEVLIQPVKGTAENSQTISFFTLVFLFLYSSL